MKVKVRKYFFIAAILQFVWGFVPTASKIVIDEIPVEVYIALRWTISGIIFAFFLSVTKRWTRISLFDFFAVSFLGVCGYGIASFGTLYGLKLGGVANFALMAAFAPAVTSFLSVWILNERPHPWFYIALPISILGLGLLFKGEIASLKVVVTSFAFIMGGLILEASVFVFSKKFKTRMSVFQYLAIAQLSTAFFLWLAQALVFHQSKSLARLSPSGWAAALFVSIVACVLCYSILYWLLSHVDGHKLSLFDGIHAISATLCGIVFFKEVFNLWMIAGGVLILSGLVIGNYPHDESVNT